MKLSEPATQAVTELLTVACQMTGAPPDSFAVRFTKYGDGKYAVGVVRLVDNSVQLVHYLLPEDVEEEDPQPEEHVNGQA